jgi:hypothetical protein
LNVYFYVPEKIANMNKKPDAIIFPYLFNNYEVSNINFPLDFFNNYFEFNERYCIDKYINYSSKKSVEEKFLGYFKLLEKLTF